MPPGPGHLPHEPQTLAIQPDASSASSVALGGAPAAWGAKAICASARPSRLRQRRAATRVFLPPVTTPASTKRNAASLVGVDRIATTFGFGWLTDEFSDTPAIATVERVRRVNGRGEHASGSATAPYPFSAGSSQSVVKSNGYSESDMTPSGGDHGFHRVADLRTAATRPTQAAAARVACVNAGLPVLTGPNATIWRAFSCSAARRSRASRNRFPRPSSNASATAQTTMPRATQMAEGGGIPSCAIARSPFSAPNFPGRRVEPAGTVAAGGLRLITSVESQGRSPKRPLRLEILALDNRLQAPVASYPCVFSTVPLLHVRRSVPSRPL